MPMHKIPHPIYVCSLICLITTFGTLSMAKASPSAKEDSFRFHLMGSPYNLDPVQARGTAGSYLFNNLYRALYRWDTDKGLIPEGAKECRFENPRVVICDLDQSRRFSNGQPIKANHYLLSFRRLMDPQTPSVQTELLLSLKNAKKILSGQSPPTELGVSAPTQNQLRFDLEVADDEFLFKLISPALSPSLTSTFPSIDRAVDLVTTGPYKIAQWKKGQYVSLTPNLFYPNHSQRPMVFIPMIDSDDTALRLFELGKLNLLRRMPSAIIPAYKDKKGFVQIPMSRFDYVGFGEAFKDHPKLREALSYSLDYEKLAKMYHSLGLPGCPSLKPELMDKVPCYRFDLKRAKKALKKVAPADLSRAWNIYYSLMAGEDIRRGMEWMQGQWKKNLGLDVRLQPVEQGMYIQTLTHNKPDIFRKGVDSDRPTCLAALEVFDKDHRENYLKISDPSYQKILKELRLNHDVDTEKRLCRKGVEWLMDRHLLIPLGQIHYSMIADQKFTGWKVNELNQLDLTGLRFVGSSL